MRPVRENRYRLIYGCLVVAEACWLYALLGTGGVLLGQGGSPLPWLAVLLLVVSGMYAGWLTMGMKGDAVSLAMALGGIGVACVYLVVAAGSFDSRGFDIAWAPRLLGGGYETKEGAGAVLALVASVLIWRRAVGLVADRYVEERLLKAFRIGTVVIAVAFLAEQVSGDDLGARTLLVPFFGVSLAGLAVARLPEQGVTRSATWVRVIALSVVAVVGTGLLLGLAGGVYGASGVHMLYVGWGMAVDALLWLVRYPLQALVTVMLAFWSWIRDLVNPGREPVTIDPIGGAPPVTPPALEQGSGSPVVDRIVDLLQYPLLALLLVAVFLALALVFRRIWSRDRKQADEDRERMELEGEASGDLARLLKGLLPAWLTRGPKPELSWRYPDGEPGIGEVFRVYFDYLSAGVKRGMPFAAAMTPMERESDLAAALPGAPVRLATERFNAACYGHEPSGADVIEELRAGLAAALGDKAQGRV